MGLEAMNGWFAFVPDPMALFIILAGEAIIVASTNLPAFTWIALVRIPVKSATDSETKPATYSDFIPATIPI